MDEIETLGLVRPGYIGDIADLELSRVLLMLLLEMRSKHELFT